MVSIQSSHMRTMVASIILLYLSIPLQTHASAKQQRHATRTIERRLAGAKHNVDKAQEELDRAIALSLQEQEYQKAGMIRNALQESSREVQEAASQLEHTLQISRQQRVSQPTPMTSLPVKTIIVNVVQQYGVECGYWSALDAVIVFNALKTGNIEAQKDAAYLLRDKTRMRAYLREMQQTLAVIDRKDMSLDALDEGGIFDIMTYYAHANEQDYSMFSTPLPYNTRNLNAYQRPIIQTIARIKRKPGSMHIFFLRSGSASTRDLGHWVSVVVHNTGKQIMCYAIDSLKSAASHHLWQRLASLLQEIQP
jgi:multidrug efflux pump subunit AcrA (membrane-fusion protein)